MNANELAAALNLSKSRISQLVSAGTLDGAWTGKGRRRVFDPHKAAALLDRKLDAGQQLGNGAAAEAARRDLLSGDRSEPAAKAPKESAQLPPEDDDRYKLARTLKAEEEARRLRRQNLEDEGRYVLADSAARETRRLMAAEIAGFEGVIRDAARAVADELGVGFKEVRAILRASWRAHRATRSAALAHEAEGAAIAEPERAEDI